MAKNSAVAKKKASAPKKDVRDLLVEIGTEELPPKALENLSQAFGRELQRALIEAKLVAEDGPIALFATPRRLAVCVPDVRQRQPDQDVERRGPALAAAFDKNGQPTGAAIGFASSCGTTPEKLERLETDKGAWLVYRMREKGQAAKKLIPTMVETALKKLPTPKRMRWGDTDIEFVRPVLWVLLLLGDEIVPAQILGQRAGNTTRGHRFLAPKPIALKSPKGYAETLTRKGWVIASFAERKQAVKTGVEALAKRFGGQAVIEDALLQEVTALVEWPHAVLGRFDSEFLAVPPEVLISSMRDHQRYFHLVDDKGRLLPAFITVANVESKNKKAFANNVVAGNERVLRARLADARFFWDTDRKTRLEERVASLKNVVFQDKLGTVYAKTERVRALAMEIARLLDADIALAGRAALLAKADLLSGMVGEFPELQGIMGRYYALEDGEPAEVAQAIAEQYLPRFAGDALPQSRTGQALAIADKLDTLIGIFGIGQAPTGDRDPFGLRRAALGVLRILVENQLDLDLPALLRRAIAGFAQLPEKTTDEVLSFLQERLRNYFLSAEKPFAPDTVDAVLAVNPASPFDAGRRLQALSVFRALPEADSLASANKRIRNILRQAKVETTGGVDAGLLQEEAEQRLAQELEAAEREVAPLLAAKDYALALQRLARLRDAVDRFFDKVMVMAEDKALRDNRLALLNKLSNLFLRVGDVSRLQVQS